MSTPSGPPPPPDQPPATEGWQPPGGGQAIGPGQAAGDGPPADYPPPGLGQPPAYGQVPDFSPGPGQPPPGQPSHGQPPYAQPPYGPPQPPAGKPGGGRRVLLLVLALAAVAVLLVGAVAVLALRGGNPRDTADAFMAALRAKDVDKAHGLLCRDGKQRESQDELRRDFDLDDRTITSYVLGTERTREREGKEETLIPVTVRYDQGPEVRLDVGVWDEGGQRVCSLNPPG